MIWKPKRVLEDEGMEWGVCLWQLPDGTYLMENGDYLVVGEYNITRAARSCGVTEGKPFWLPGFRKISDSEHDDQMERLLEGKVPDAADLYRQATGDYA
jgi:hypothetical protein